MGPLLDQWANLDLAEGDFGALRLEQDLALGEAGFGPDVDEGPIEDRGDGVAVADDRHAVPLANRLLHIAPAPETEDVFPARIAAPPVKSSRVASDGLPSLFEVKLTVRP